MAVLDGDFCTGMTHVSNGPALVYRFDPGPNPVDIIAGVTVANFKPILYALESCDQPAPFLNECTAASVTQGTVKPSLVLKDVSKPLNLVLDSVAGEPWGSFEFAVLTAQPASNDNCSNAIDVTGKLPYSHTGHTLGASNDCFAPVQSCVQLNFQAAGAGPDVIFAINVNQELLDQHNGIKWTLNGATYLAQIWVMKNACALDGSTCLKTTGSSLMLTEQTDYKLGDKLYFVVDGANADSAGMYSVTLEGQ